ncbi:MAG: Gfo/Idh/MocA family oxidoreductase [bacterium]|nr:Gfo/Idh/MocA family oxidoreductase [bacterium]
MKSTASSDSALSRRGFLRDSSLAATALAPASFAAGRRKVRVGVVGGRFGLQFQWHLHPDAEVTAVCDIRADRRTALSEQYQTANTFASFDEMLRHPELDAVAVFTPAPLHAWMSIRAMEAGKHVISAVPAGVSIEELERLIECVKRTGMRYMMAETTYYRPQIITCRQWAAEKRFGEIFYSESEYHHNISNLMFDERGLPTWRHGYPPMFYITHQTGAIVPVTGERLVEVKAMGWGDGHEVLETNRYQNPFWNTVGFFETSAGHASRISVFWRAPAGFAQRSQFYGSKLSYVMGRAPENHPDTSMRFGESHKVIAEAQEEPQEKHWHLLPKELHVKTGHAGSHTHITHDFIRAIIEDRHPQVNVWEAAAYTAPGVVAHHSALRSGELMKIPDLGSMPS